jgi:hypothetical protein
MFYYYLLGFLKKKEEVCTDTNKEGHSTATVNLRMVSSSDMSFSSL